MGRGTPVTQAKSEDSIEYSGSLLELLAPRSLRYDNVIGEAVDGGSRFRLGQLLVCPDSNPAKVIRREV
jgi:hypothetical protein